MYQYSDKDKQIVKNRTKEFLSQVKRRIEGNLTEEEFKPLRLMNGLYLQLHAYMLRVAIPYGELSHIQLNKLAEISEKYDKGYGHFTTRQNIQFNWPKLEDVPKILNELAGVEMHAIQTAGNCIRNISCDHLAGINNGGGQGRSPFIAKKINNFVKKKDLLNYLEAILSIYNEMGRRDNIYKARIKILINELGAEKLKSLIESKFKKFADKKLLLEEDEIKKIKNYFKLPINDPIKSSIPVKKNKEYNIWLNQNVIKHKLAGYSIIMVSLKHYNQPPGDATAEQMKKLSIIAKQYSHGEIRVTHEQNLVLPHIKNSDLFSVWNKLRALKLATPNICLITDTICCPGMDYCALATARSIPISQKISQHFKDQSIQDKIGNIKIKISGCINACGHHHVGIFVLNGYFLSVFNRVGIDPFKKDLYDKSNP